MTRDEYATFIYYFGARNVSKEEQAELIPDLLQSLETKEWAQPDVLSLPIAGFVSAMEALYPDRVAGWRKRYPALRRRVLNAISKSHECPEWTDFHLAQWFILRHEESLDACLDRVAEGGEVGRAAIEKLQALASQSAPFQKALDMAKRARESAMIIQ